MEIGNFFLTLFLILLLARFLGELFSRYNMPSVLGEVSAGLLLGASGFGLIEPNEILKILAEIGIILLLFEVGLETDFQRMKESGTKSITVAILGVILPFAFGFIISRYLFDLSFEIALFIGGTLTATSIGITLRVLQDIHMEKTNVAQIVIGAAVIDDIIGIILLVFVYDFSANHNMNFTHTIEVSMMILGFILIAPIVAKALSELILLFKNEKRLPGYMPTIVICLILLFLGHLMLLEPLRS